MTANSFGLHISTVANVIHDVYKLQSYITHHLGPKAKYTNLPKDENEMRKTVAEFEVKYGQVQAFGCIDGTHIPLKKPTINSQDYLSYKMYTSL